MWSPRHACFDIEYGNHVNNYRPSDTHLSPLTRLHIDPEFPNELPTNFLRRRRTRSNTVISFDSITSRPDWQPGQEPGLDPSQKNGGRAQTLLHEECQITVVDFSADQMRVHDFGNAEFIEFLKKPQDTWARCRWINVNGLSWDVIQALGSHKNLHRLALEDLTNTTSRTKADWYADHTYIVLPLQKLVDQSDREGSQSNTDNISGVDSPRKIRGRVSKFFHKFISAKTSHQCDEKNLDDSKTDVNHPGSNEFVTGTTEGNPKAPVRKLRNIRGYHGGPNHERMVVMQSLSPLTKRNLAVNAEQVSIFITADNTVISFFESSADDIELPILPRLSTRETTLRRSCDASMVAQAIVDAIIDLAIPITTAYRDVIGDLELDVLTEPSIKHTTSLYIVTSEITMMRNFLSPIINLISALRDHQSPGDIAAVAGIGFSKSFQGGVRISPMAQTYLGDVEDHIILMIKSLDQMRKSCDNMIDLIFNTIAAYQNQSMKQLTIVTILFLPLTFITGFFGMNIQNFAAIRHDESYFWYIAIPTVIGTTIFLTRDSLRWWLIKFLQRRGIARSRKGRLAREAQEERNEPAGVQ